MAQSAPDDLSVQLCDGSDIIERTPHGRVFLSQEDMVEVGR